MEYHSNINIVVGQFTSKLKELQQNPDPMLRTVALAILPEVKKRVHVSGKDSNDSKIGTYSPGYMKLRTGDYQNSSRYSKGKNKGKAKDSGTFTERTIKLDKKSGVFSGEEKVGKQRPKYNRTGDTDVILSLTRQMENDESVMPSGSGYGIGFNNSFNFQKSQWNEKTYNKKIWPLTKTEKDLAKSVAEDYVSDFLNNK